MSMVDDVESRCASVREGGEVIYRHRVATRLTHWTWAIALFFLLLSGLQIFNAHPTLYIGKQSGFEFDNSVLSMRPMRNADGSVDGYTTVLGQRFKTTGLFGMSGSAENPSYRGFPAWATLPSYQDLATGRVIHFFFAWVFAAAFLIWLFSSLVSGHLRRDILPSLDDIKSLPRSIGDHLQFRFHREDHYNGLQKFAYAAVLLLVFPLIILTGLAMSPGMNAAWPWFLDLFGGRQTARSIHFLCMALLVVFFLVHVVMIVAAGPLNEMRSILTGWYRTDPEKKEEPGA
ncbi:MAG TPA: cytochrome b/b6 domain-containing protein [Pararhizobium sp.]|uniref:cytochrome b/b6 domain-containing protein n=1 Tax=Pararhizobium sp. TaxID=1977563 RepID=UPI002CE6CB3A|nr:cytochrome b/b6 domain-containing protein [Pararhizobium sp.]HTO33467.1 cytochrome b/b6 domain-containing protein [Pararhizobium sp.]